jgi:O-methyltransferase
MRDLVLAGHVSIGSSLCSENAIAKLLDLLDRVIFLEGNIAEVGMYKGGTALKILQSYPNEQFYGFDNFEEGMPSASNYDNHQEGDFKDTSYDSVKELLKEFKNAKIYKGVFPATNSEVVKNSKFKFVHLDVDIYPSYVECLNFFYDKMVKGGIILCDDYKAESCPGAKKAIDEFALLKNIELHEGNDYQVYIIKQ